MTLIFDIERLLSSGCVQVHYLTTYNNQYSSIGYIDNLDFLFGSAFQIMNMHRDLSSYNGDQTHTNIIVPIAYASNEGAYRYH